MKKENNLPWIGLAVVLLIIGILYSWAKSDNVSSTNYTNPIPKNESQIADCAKQAQIVLENERKNPDKSMSFSQTNHFNITLNKCLIELNVTINDSGSVIFSTEIRDAYEQKTFLSCISGSLIKSPYCFIPGNYSTTGQAINMTKEEGDSKIRDYMSN